VSIRKLTYTDNEIYESLLTDDGTIFNEQKWLMLYGNLLEHFGIFDKDNKLIGAFYLYKSVKFGITYYITPPYTPHIGLIYKNKTSNKANALTYNKTIISEIADFINVLPCSFLTIAFPLTIIDLQPFIWKKFKVTPNYTYQLDLSLSESELFQNMSSDKRNSLKKADKDGLKTIQVNDYKIVKQLILKTFSRKKKSVDSEFINKILNTFATSQNSFAFVSYNNDKPICAAFCILDNHTCYYLLGGYDNDNKHQAAGVIVIWQCILHAKQKNLKIFDFEGSMLPEVEKYFRGFGGNLIPYYRVSKAKLVVELGLKLIKKELH
jgi:hypothetical protein